MGSTQMEVTSELEEMTDHSAEVSDPDCLGAIYGAEEPVYAGSGWTAMRDQVAREPGEDNDTGSSRPPCCTRRRTKAQKFFDDVEVDVGELSRQLDFGRRLDATYLWQIDDVAAEDTLITQITTQEDAGGWACQHALVGGLQRHRRGVGVRLRHQGRGGDDRHRDGRQRLEEVGSLLVTRC